MILGDCLEIVPRLAGRYGVVVTDPPFGISMKSSGGSTCVRFGGAGVMEGDGSAQAAERLAGLVAGCPLVMFYSPYQALNLGWRSVLVWDKGRQVGGGGDWATCWKRDFELIGVRDNGKLNGKRESAILRYPSPVIKPTGFFAEKPVELMSYLVGKVARAGAVVLDPFAGTGSTGVACARLGLGFIGIEINEGRYLQAVERIRAECTE